MCSSYCFCISARQLLLCIPSCFAHIPFYNAFPLSLPSNWPALSLPPSSSRCRCCTKQRSLAMGELWRLQGQTFDIRCPRLLTINVSYHWNMCLCLYNVCFDLHSFVFSYYTGIHFVLYLPGPYQKLRLLVPKTSTSRYTTHRFKIK